MWSFKIRKHILWQKIKITRRLHIDPTIITIYLLSHMALYDTLKQCSPFNQNIIKDVHIGYLISPVGSNSKTTIIHTRQFRNFAGESPRNSRDPAGSSVTRKVFEIGMKMQGL